MTVLYHYFHPDNVVSAKLYSDFCTELAARGWQVEALPCNRGYWNRNRSYPRNDKWNGIHIRRVWRPDFPQSSNLGRVLNAGWMILAWSALAFRSYRRLPRILVIGTDPILGVLVALIVKRFRPRIRIVHWCFDLYPEAIVADGMVRENSLLVRILKRMLRGAYASCDLLADLGSCMRARLESYGHTCRKSTLTTWALSEPGEVVRPDPAARAELFGDAALGLLYAGGLGRGHSYEGFLQLARLLRDDKICFCFGIRGRGIDKFRNALGPEDKNVCLAGFVAEDQLARRLGAADIHLVSLHPDWTGVLIPSKFFGSLAAGRPVLFEGSSDSAVAEWIREHGVGWVLDRDSRADVAQTLKRLAREKEELHALQQHCHDVYHRHFSKMCVMDRWHEELCRLRQDPQRASGASGRGGRT